MRRFTIKSYGSDFLTGATNDGRCVLMGLLCPELAVVFFDSQGRLSSCETRPLAVEPPRMGTTGVSWETDSGVESLDGIRLGPYQIGDPAFQASLQKDLDELKRDIGFVEGRIEVQQFSVDDKLIGIELLPEHLADFKDDPDSAEDDDREDLEESLREWEDEGSFVLWWGKEYWVSPDGEVEST